MLIENVDVESDVFNLSKTVADLSILKNTTSGIYYTIGMKHKDVITNEIKMIKFNLFKKITISINSFETDRRIVINLIDGKVTLEFKENIQENSLTKKSVTIFIMLS